MRIVKSIFFVIVFSIIVCNIFADFTIGVYCVGKPEEVSYIKEAGFNTIQTYNKDPNVIYELAKEAKKQGVTLLAYPDKIIGSPLQKEIQEYPIIWYLCDEPDLWKVLRVKLKSADEKTRKTFPGAKTAFVIGEGKTKVPYYDIADILMVDWYPVPHLPLESFGQQISYARQELNAVKSKFADLWAVVQMFDWSEEKALSDLVRKKYKLRFPTKKEIRFMSYDALFNGATGLFYFRCNSKGIPLYKSKPEEWKYITELIQELVFTTKLFEEGIPVCNPTCDKKNNFCDICKTDTYKITGNESFFKMKSFEYAGTKYTILINPTERYQTIPKIFYDKKFDVLFEEDISLSNIVKNKSDNLEPYKVFVFRYN